MYPHSYRLLLVGCNLTFVQKKQKVGCQPYTWICSELLCNSYDWCCLNL